MRRWASYDHPETQLSAAWCDELDTRIDQLVRLRNSLADCIGCGCLSLDRCLLRNRDDRLGDRGSGPRRLLTRALRRELDRPAESDPAGREPGGSSDDG